MKKGIIYVILAIMILSMVSAEVQTDGNIVDDTLSFENLLTVSGGEYIGDNFVELSFWDKIRKIIKPSEFSFIDAPSDVVEDTLLCELRDGYGSFDKPIDKNVRSGGSCKVGEYILYQSNGGDIARGEFLFEDAWRKSNIDDMPHFRNYYVNDLSFSYSYACYECLFTVEKETEKGCLSINKQYCTERDDDKCFLDYRYESVCEQFVLDFYSCDWSSRPTKSECEKLENDALFNVNDCRDSEVDDCFDDIFVEKEEPNEVVEDVRCYSCLGENTISEVFKGKCPNGYSDKIIDCTIPIDEQDLNITQEDEDELKEKQGIELTYFDELWLKIKNWFVNLFNT